MKVLVASAPHHDTFGYSMPPPGLLRLGAAVRGAGHEVRLRDLAFELAGGRVPAGDGLFAAAARSLLAEEPEVLGLSTMGATLPAALLIAGEVRALSPALPLLVGGPGCTGLDAALLERFPQVDAVVRGEGEETLPAALEAWALRGSFAGVAGVTHRGPDGAVVREPDRAPLRDLDALPLTDWSLLAPLDEYKAITGEVEGLVPVDSGRGCVYDCSFCTIGRFWSRRSRTLSPARLVEEVLRAADQPGARNAYLCHDLFGVDRRAALEFCELLAATEREVPWECRARADHLDRELLRAMRRAGAYRVLLGIESADAGVRERNQKGMRADVDLMRTVRECSEEGVVPILSLILGLPGEDEGGLRATLDFCAEACLHSGVHLSLHLPNPQPGCALGEEFGAESRPVEGIPPDMAWGAGHTGPERALIEAHPELFSSFALLPLGERRLHDLHDLTVRFPELLMRYPRTFALLRAESGEDALDLYRRWTDDGRSFETFVAESGTPAAVEALSLEQAVVRAAARGDGVPAPDAPRARGEVLTLRHDLPALFEDLRAGRPARAVERDTILAVLPRGQGARMLRVSRDVAALLRLCDGRARLDELERDHPGIGAALTRLSDSGLVDLPATRDTTSLSSV